MIIEKGHLSYCTNIHAGETWKEIFSNLETYLLEIKHRITKEKPFGIGLRLSFIAAKELSNKRTLDTFKNWLGAHNLYIFTMNGFPYGSFHGEVIKDQVHAPDWTESNRKEYTKLLFDILVELLPQNIDGGISTSPISYKFWHKTETELHIAKTRACEAISEIACHLHNLKNATGKSLHLDIEPEPDGIIENSLEFVEFYNGYLLHFGVAFVKEKLNCSKSFAEEIIREHIQLCFDICHSAVAYERPSEVLEWMNENKIKIGKLQLSSALKCSVDLNNDVQKLQGLLMAFHEPNYLHQAIIKTKTNDLVKFPDLDLAIREMPNLEFSELRTHYHVPIFLADYQNLCSTQDDLIEVLKLWKEKNFTNHLEIETYTWDVLPDQMQTDIISAVTREMNWVLNQIN